MNRRYEELRKEEYERYKRYSPEKMLIMSAVASFIGWVVENVWLMMRNGYMNNRNMHFPFLIGYGAAIMGFYYVAGTPDDPGPILKKVRGTSRSRRVTAYYIFAVIAVSLGEMTIGLVSEKLFGFHYWDYTVLPLHITRYTSIPTSCAFALLIFLFMDKAFTPIMEFLDRFSDRSLKIAAAVLTFIMVFDFLSSFRMMSASGKRNAVWKIEFKRSSVSGSTQIKKII